MSKISLLNPLIQSPYTYLQAAGSDGSDRTVRGAHLRWDFLKSLGENHLAKGNYSTIPPYATGEGFNRPNDFIGIFRTRFVKQYFVKLDFNVNQTTELITESSRTWKYTLAVDSLSGVTTGIVVRFIDSVQYDAIRSAQPTLNTIDLLNRYSGIVEVEPENKLFFYAEFDLKFKGGKVGPPPDPKERFGEDVKLDVPDNLNKPDKFEKPETPAKPEKSGKFDKFGKIDKLDPKIDIIDIVLPEISGNAGFLRTESVTIPDTSDFTLKQVSCRKKFTNTLPPFIISCENIQYMRFDYVGAIWKEIRIYCYEEYITGTNASLKGDWQRIGDFSLTTDDLVATTRFNPNKIDGPGSHWPKFNDDNASTGEFVVKKQNYFDRWRKPGLSFNPNNTSANDINGLQHFVHRYMELSVGDGKGLFSLSSDLPNDPSTQDISYLEMIRLMSLDFHVARILGLGHIDDYGELQAEPYIYCLEYKTYYGLDAPHETNDERTHIFMTAPVSVKDYRLPEAPKLTQPTYGISVDNGTPTPTLLTDPQGYAPFGNLRFININRGPFHFEKPFGPFYYDPTEFCLCDETQPIAFGLEYKEIGETSFRKPEISHDSDYFDAAGISETIPILEGGKPTIYTHQEIEEGTHEYGAYSINWFSRISKLSNSIEVQTLFPKQSYLLPPFNFAVQLIQDEDPVEPVIAEKALILTTPAEQQMLAGIPPADQTLVRATFDWNQVHHHAHQYADYAEIFFRKAEPLVVKGKIDTVTLLPNNRAQITVTSYELTSVFPVAIVLPIVSQGDEAKYEGSFFSSGGENYIIESVDTSSIPLFTIKLIKQIDAIGSGPNSNQLISLETYQAPNPNDLFFATENMGAISNWDLKHRRKIYLEKFYSNAKVTLRFSPARTTDFDIKAVSIISGISRIKVVKPIKTNLIPGLTLEYSVKHEITAVAPKTLTLSGNLTQDFSPGKLFRVFANKVNDGLYTVNSSSFTSTNTVIVTNEPIPDVLNFDGLIEIVVSRSIISISSNSFNISGNKVAEIDAAYCEYKPESDGTLSRFVVGGIYDIVTFEPILTVPPPIRTPATPFVIEGTGFIQLKFQNYNLIPHSDHEVNWYKGTVRLKNVSGTVQAYPVTFIGNLTTSSSPHLNIVVQDPGFIPKSAYGNNTGIDIYSVDMITGDHANYHPSYKIYLPADNGFNPATGVPLTGTDIHFDKMAILPVLADPYESHRQTLMSIRSYDAKNELGSFLSNPVVLLAQKISLPKKPNKPNGPLYATYPDFYGKSTYTFDTVVDTNGRLPYSIVFYRGSEDRILDVLYRKSTQKKIWQDLNNLTDPKAKYDPLLWDILFDCDNGPNDATVFNPPTPLPPVCFRTYKTTAGQFTWPLPDNDGGIGFIADPDEQKLEENRDGYIFPFDMDNHPLAVFRPFECDKVTGLPLFDLSAMYNVYGKMMSAKAILKKAIMSVFLPLAEQPPIYNYIKEGTQTSGVKPKSRDAFGNVIDPLQNDTLPMIKRFTNSLGETVIRFTDYTLDGASISLYFYRALEMDDKFKFSEEGLPVGPVLMVNAFPPNKPQIRKSITQLQDFIANKSTAVLFEINKYSENEKISKVEIYRAIDEMDALSIRTMKMVKSVSWGTPIIDDFSDLGYPLLAYPLYGETLFYRIIAIREIEDVKDPMAASNFQTTLNVKITDLPSLPSDIVQASIVDVVNPAAPKIFAENGITTLTELKNVILKWKHTAYNGTYYLQKLNSSGNWVEKYRIKVKDKDMQYPPLLNNSPDFTNYHETQNLPRIDADNNPIYHRFRVQVENSSGLFNLQESELTLAKGTSDLQEVESVLSYSDANNPLLPLLKTYDIVKGSSQPDSMTFIHLNNPLPAGHNNFQKIEITVSDDLAHSFTRTINSAGGNAVFLNGDGGLVFDATSPNRAYTIRTKLFTDYIPANGIPNTSGATQVFTINYLAGPCYDLKLTLNLIKITDGNHVFNPAVTSVIKNGVAFPTQLKIEPSVDLQNLGQNISQIIVTVKDDLGNIAIKTIDNNNPFVIFNTFDNLVVDGSNPNRTYDINLKVSTLECSMGNDVSYKITYAYTPCDDLTSLVSIAKIIDGNQIEKILTASQTMSGSHPNGLITIIELISGLLPQGHTFIKLDVLLEDDLGGAYTQSIQNAGGSVTFNHGDGNLVLNASNPHRTYYLSFVLFTDLCINGSNYSYAVKY